MDAALAAESFMTTRSKDLGWRILVGCLGLYPTLLLVLSLLGPLTHDLSFPLMVLVEVVVWVPFTQIISFPLAGWLVSRLRRINQ